MKENKRIHHQDAKTPRKTFLLDRTEQYKERTMRRVSIWKTIIVAVTAGLAISGCGMLKGPISPLIDPPVASFGSFDNGTISGWEYDYSGKVKIDDYLPLTTTSQAFQGAFALEIPIRAYGRIAVGEVSAGVTVQLSAHAVHYQYPAEVDLTDKTLSMWVYWKSGIVSSPDKIGAQLFIKDDVQEGDSNWQYANGTFYNLSPNKWTQVTYNVNSPNWQADPPPILTRIRQVGLQIAGDGSSIFTSDGVIIADSFGY
jgi:hypothetical protein